MPDVKRIGGGLLGADYKIENGRYRFDRVYHGENWNPDLKAPLTAARGQRKAGRIPARRQRPRVAIVRQHLFVL